MYNNTTIYVWFAAHPSVLLQQVEYVIVQIPCESKA